MNLKKHFPGRSRRQRKLNYIRMKNAIRKGRELCVFQKVTREYLVKVEPDLRHIFEPYLKFWSAVYKLPLKFKRYKVGSIDDDMYRGILTAKYVFGYDTGNV